MEGKTLKSKFERYVEARSKIDSNDSFAIYKKWDELIKLLSKDENETIELLKTSTKEEIEWISEVMEEVAEKLDSNTYIETLKSISKKYPECNLEDTIDISVKYMKSKYET